MLCLLLFRKTLVASKWSGKPAEIAPSYEGRASMEVNNLVSTLQLTKVTLKDSRRFQCSILIRGDDEGKPSATTYLLVLGEDE